jgi:hypothetical protein
MNLQHRTVIVKLNEQVELPDTTIMAGTHIETDGKGGWNVVIHVLERTDAIPLINGQKALTQ